MVDIKNETELQKSTLKESFAALFEQSVGSKDDVEGSVLKGTVANIENGFVTIDVGLKSSGRLPVREFIPLGESEPSIKVGDEVDVYVERMEDKNGEVSLSHEKAKREATWDKLEGLHAKKEKVKGVIFARVKGGFTVDLDGAVAFLPGSQVDIRPIKDTNALIGVPQPFIILKMDKKRGNIIVSRRAVLEESRADTIDELVSNLHEGQKLQGVVKNITDYGAFVDLGGVDGLLHLTDITWRRINHPTEILSLGQTIEVQVIRYNKETCRISLGMKQLEEDPWKQVGEKYPKGKKTKGRVTNITEYGAFVELEPGIEGLIHVTEMSWTRKNVHPGKLISTSEEVEVMVLDIEPEKRRISLGLKQCHENPWDLFSEHYKVGDAIEGLVKNITEFGIFVALPYDLDGMIRKGDLSWEKDPDEALRDYKKGDPLKAVILEVDVNKAQILLGLKQQSQDPFEQVVTGVKKGDVVTCIVDQLLDGGIQVKINDRSIGFIKRGDLSRERAEQRLDRFAVGEKVDAKVVSVDKAERRILLSIKHREIDEDKQAIAAYGSSDSGASLGDILGAAISQAQSKQEEKEVGKEEKKEPKKAATKAKPKKASTAEQDEGEEAEVKKSPKKKTAASEKSEEESS